MNKTLIKETLQTNGWKEIELLLNEEINKLSDVTDINKTGSVDDIGKRTLARGEAVTTIRKFLTKLKKIEMEEPPKKKTNYK